MSADAAGTSACATVLAVLLPLAATAAVIDRVAVVIGATVITESEVIQEVRLTQFLNNQPLDLSPTQRRAAAERLVDQQLIRNEMQAGAYAQPSAAEADTILRNFRQERYPSQAQYQAALDRYGLTEEDLKQHLLWQAAVMRFTSLRFQAPPAAPAESGANRYQAGGEPDQMDAWLKETRAQTRIQFKKEAFQ